MAQITTAQGFLEYYHLEASDEQCDKNPATRKLDNPDLPLTELKADFYLLPADEQYCVLDHLKHRGDRALLRAMLGSTDTMKGVKRFGLSPMLDHRLHALREKLSTYPVGTMDNHTLWQMRKDLWVNLFAIEDLLELGALCLTRANDPLTHDTYRGLTEEVRRTLANIYADYWPNETDDARGNPLWNTDGDRPALPTPEMLDRLFDHRDPQPLEARTTFSPKLLQLLKIGETVGQSPLQVQRTGLSTFTLILAPTVYAASGKEHYVTPEFLAQIQRALEAEFVKQVAPGERTFNLRVNFQVVTAHSNGAICLGAPIQRAHSRSWPDYLLKAFSTPSSRDNALKTMFHELGHSGFLLGDYYDEAGTVRHHTLQPGFQVLTAKKPHIMRENGPSTFSQNDLAALATRVIQNHYYPRARQQSISYNFFPPFYLANMRRTLQRQNAAVATDIYVQDVDLHNYKIDLGIWQYLARDGTPEERECYHFAVTIVTASKDEALSAIRQFATDHPDDVGCQLYVAQLENLFGEGTLATPALVKLSPHEFIGNLVLKMAYRNNPEDIGISQAYAYELEGFGKYREAYAVWARLCSRHPEDEYCRLRALWAAGKFQTAEKLALLLCKWVEAAVHQINRKLREGADYIEGLRELYQRGGQWPKAIQLASAMVKGPYAQQLFAFLP